MQRAKFRRLGGLRNSNNPDGRRNPGFFGVSGITFHITYVGRLGTSESPTTSNPSWNIGAGATFDNDPADTTVSALNGSTMPVHGGTDFCPKALLSRAIPSRWVFSPQSRMIPNFGSHERDLELYWAGGD